jgi:o-succinylbenzoate synthase
MTAAAPLPAIHLDAIDLVRVSLPLVRPFTTSFGRQTAREALLVRVRSDGVEGWGEVVTGAAPLYSEEFTDAAELVLRDHLVPTLLSTRSEVDAAEVARLLATYHGHHMAKAGLELAVLDAQLRRAGVALAEHLGAVVDRVPTGVSVGIPDGGMDELIEQVAAYLDEGYLRIKAKIQPGFDVAPMQRLRHEFGPSLSLQVDANAAYEPDDIDHVKALDGLDELDLVMIEQPFGVERLRAHARHSARWRTPICLDESIHDARAAKDAVETGAAGIINIKLGRVGGIHEAVRVRDVCRARGIPVWCGGMLETGVGRAANVALAAIDGFHFPGDLSASERYFTRDLTDPFVLDDGHIAVPTGPGIGREPHADLIDAARVTSVTLPT